MSTLDKRSVRKIITSYDKILEAKQFIQSIIPKDTSIEVIDQIVDVLDSVEDIVKRPLTQYANDTLVGRWSLSQYGIGPVLAAGLASHIDITKANTAGGIWRYAGLDPHAGDTGKIAYNGELKNICWKIGLNFAKYSNRSQCFYGKLYLQDKARRSENNTSPKPLSKEQIDAQARRFAVKIFLSHYHAIAYQDYHGQVPARPSHIYIDGFEQEILIPNNPFEAKN